MARTDMAVDLSTLVDAALSGDSNRIVAVSRQFLEHTEEVDVIIGRIGLEAARGDADGHTVITLAAAAMLSRMLHTIPQPLEGDIPLSERALPLFVQALLMAAPAIQAGKAQTVQYPEPLFPSQLGEHGNVGELMDKAIKENDVTTAERLMFGLYGTGADYRTLEVRTYESIATTFQDAGHPLMFAVRGFQLLDAVEWGIRAPAVIHWLAPHLPLRPASNEPDWVQALRTYTEDSAHSMASIRTRIGAPKDEQALPLRSLILSDKDTTQVCQGVYDAIINGKAGARAVGSVIALAGADIMAKVSDGDRTQFINAAHGLLFTAATRLVFRQVQDVEVLPLLYTSAAYANALYKQVAAQPSQAAEPAPGTATIGGGLIAPAQLETLRTQLQGQDLPGALATARRYLKLGHDPRALWAMIALAAARNDAHADQGHTLQIVQAASEEFLAWPTSLAATSPEPFLHVALRAAAFGTRSSAVENL